MKPLQQPETDKISTKKSYLIFFTKLNWSNITHTFFRCTAVNFTPKLSALVTASRISYHYFVRNCKKPKTFRIWTHFIFDFKFN